MASIWITYSTSRAWHCVGLLGILVAAGGCSSNDSDIARVHGKVTIDGQPMTWGRVQFAPVATADNRFPGKPAFGWIQPDGSFELSTHGTNDGALVGQHRVTLYCVKPDSEQESQQDASAPNPGPNLKFDSLLLAGRHFEVQQGVDNEIPIELTTDYVKQYGMRRD